MSCKLCKEIYNNLPCLNKNTVGYILKSYMYSTYEKGYLRHLISVHNLLTGYCPCKECLVRSMCNESESCTDYISRTRAR